MGTRFSDFIAEIEDEARKEGPRAVAELQRLRAHFRLGRELAEARRKRGMTQSDVAKVARIGQAEVSDIERGAGNPTLGTLNAVAESVGLEIRLIRARRFARKSVGTPLARPQRKRGQGRAK